MFLTKIFNDIMGRGGNVNEDDSDSETVDEETTESDKTTSTEKQVEFLGIPLYKLSYKHLPKSCIKFSFLLLNALTLLVGITAFVSSIWLLTDGKLISGFIGYRAFVTTLLFIGLFISSVAFTGILGFVKRRRQLLVIYIACHSLFLCAIFSCAIMSFVLFDKILRSIKEDMRSSMYNYRSLGWATESWDNTHRYLKCCGIKSPKDWHEVHAPIPQSCCSMSIDKCLRMTDTVAYKSGCYKNVVLLLKSYLNAISISTLLLSIALLAGIFFALGVRKRFKRYRARAS